MNKDDTYSIDDLLHATRELEHHKGVLKDKQAQLSAKRAAIKSFEEAEAMAAQHVAEWEVKVRRIASKLEK